jgi:FkbM family methyltransferase
VLFEQVADLEHVSSRYVRHRGTIVQAGGNCGVWPKHASSSYHFVYTFEPDALNFEALCANLSGRKNVFAFRAALGAQNMPATLDGADNNCGAYTMRQSMLGEVPVIRIDDLGLARCDLIYLDVEGMEYAALMGAQRTIARFSPVVAFEDKGLGKNYGVAAGDIQRWLELDYDYEVRERVRADTVMVSRR